MVAALLAGMSQPRSSSRGNLASPLLAALISLVLSGPLWGCMTGAFLGDDMSDDAGAGSWPDARKPWGDGNAPAGEACDKMDILFVVDDSLSMREEQTNLADNFPGFIDILEQRIGGSGQPLDYRVAVTTTGRDVNYTVSYPIGYPPGQPTNIPVSANGANGAFPDDPACGASRRWIERGDPDVTGTFSCLAQVGIGGSNLEMPLLATELAFVDRVADGTNAGFLRPSALHAIVILTDEDDCSRRAVNFVIGSFYSDICSEDPGFDDSNRYIDTLDTVTGGRERWAVAVIAGPGPGKCTNSEFGDALEARRLKRFVADVGDNAVFSSICEGDLAVALTEALATFGEACEALPPIP